MKFNSFFVAFLLCVFLASNASSATRGGVQRLPVTSFSQKETYELNNGAPDIVRRLVVSEEASIFGESMDMPPEYVNRLCEIRMHLLIEIEDDTSRLNAILNMKKMAEANEMRNEHFAALKDSSVAVQ